MLYPGGLGCNSFGGGIVARIFFFFSLIFNVKK